MASRILIFKDDKLFEMTYEGFLTTARGTNPKEHEWVDEILQKLECISVQMSPPETVPGFNPNDTFAPNRRVLDPASDGIVLLEDQEYSFLKKCLDMIATAAPLSRYIRHLHKFIAAAESGDAKKLLAAASMSKVKPGHAIIAAN